MLELKLVVKTEVNLQVKKLGKNNSVLAFLKFLDGFVVAFLKFMDGSVLVSINCMGGSVLAHLRCFI